MKTGRIRDGYGNIQRDIMTDKRVDIFAKSVYCLLISYAGDKTCCYPSLKTICENLQISKPTVIKAIKQLIEVGFIVADKRKTKLGEHEANIYYPMYIMDEGVVNDVDNPVKVIYQGSKVDLPPVVNDVDTKINNSKINNKDNSLVFNFGFKQNKVKKEKSYAKKESQESKENFDIFWDLYGHKVGIAESKKRWAKIELVEQRIIISIVPDWKKYHDPKISIPYPSTFLNNERWKDEINRPKIQITNSVKPSISEIIFPDEYDPIYESKLSKFDRMEYENHLRKNGRWVKAS